MGKVFNFLSFETGKNTHFMFNLTLKQKNVKNTYFKIYGKTNKDHLYG